MKQVEKQLLRICCLMILFLPAFTWAETLTAQLNVNSSDLEAKVEGQVYQFQANLFAGAGFLYSKDDYWVANLNFSARDSVISPALNVGLGLKGILARVDFDHHDYNASAIGFMALGAYDFRKDYTQLPIKVATAFTIAPYVLSFGDTDLYMDYHATVYGYFIPNAAVLAGYRYTDLRFKTRFYKDKKADDAIFAGVSFTF